MQGFWDFIFDNAIVTLAIFALGRRLWQSLMKKNKESSEPRVSGAEPEKTRQIVPQIFEFLRELDLEEKEKEKKPVSPTRFFPADRQSLRQTSKKTGTQEQLSLRAEPAAVKEKQERPEKVRRQRTVLPFSATLFATRRDLSRGIVLAEVLGPPLSKRKNKAGVMTY